ncbi:ribokinase [Nocardia bhagyanarayanae]|uniref:Ribokinase n=1 Tax=Nocardia bhagyanarayanae TaxID=1215925 RepID=A0A543EVL4_9NOCA|nr:ribokinase [Nocardia bhagyanarayanae]TQM25623.1 ribokinase [Nocardia bhagyanarayanae]
MTADAPAIAVLGSINMDLVTTTRRRPAPGETVLGSGFTMVPGGKGSNQAIAARRAGGAVSFLGAVGSDVFAGDLRRVLTASGVGADRLRTVPGPSGIAAIVVDDTGENSIIVVGGANATLTELTSDDLAVIAASDVLLCQLEIPVQTVAAAARHARANGTVVMLNPSPAQRLPSELWEFVDVAVVNSGEEVELGGALNAVEHLVVTRGAAGATYRGPDGAELSVPGLPVDVVDTTGAGDTFTGALAAAWHRGPRTALQWACAAGALATTRLGASTAIPDRELIEALLGEHSV